MPEGGDPETRRSLARLIQTNGQRAQQVIETDPWGHELRKVEPLLNKAIKSIERALKLLERLETSANQPGLFG